MDVVLKSLLKTFRETQDLPVTMNTQDLFEHFANYCVASKEYTDEFNIEALSVGGGDDLGIDGICIIVNGVLVNSTDEVDDLFQANKHLNVRLIFVQAKSGSNFKGSEISSMFYGVKELFSDSAKMPRNELLAEKEKIIRHIYENSAYFRPGNPTVKLFYVTTGKWTSDEKLVNRINGELDDLEELNIFFPKPSFLPIDARTLQDYFKRSLNVISKTVMFPSRVTIPAMNDVQEAYLGYLSILDYLNLITDDDGNLLRGLFNENVRDFQGDNSVNKEIEETLQNDAKKAFVLMNNGITIVSEEASSTGDRFTLTGFNIVNGCQTSHVLHNNRDLVTNVIKLANRFVSRMEFW